MTTSINSIYAGSVERILARYYANKIALSNPAAEADPYDKDPPRNIRSFRQQSQDQAADAMQTARDVGTLTRGETRLNVVSALTSGDLVDFYKFKVSKEGKLAMSVTTDKGVHVQLLKKSGVVIADSEASFGDKKDNFEKMAAGKLDVSADTYYIKVTRSSGSSRSERPNYAIQLSMSRYFEKDYDTVETPAARASTQAGALVHAANTSAVSAVLNQFAGGTLFDTLI